jgi:hypothetical protein
VRIAELPDRIRGYEGLKLERIREYRKELHNSVEGFASAVDERGARG